MFTISILSVERRILAEAPTLENAMTFLGDCLETSCYSSGWHENEGRWAANIYDFYESWGPGEPLRVARILAPLHFYPPKQQLARMNVLDRRAWCLTEMGPSV